MSKFTPGPWLFKGPLVTAANGWSLASTHFPSAMPSASDMREPGESWLDASIRLKPEGDRIKAEMEANACLMAAAPELLEALKDVLNNCLDSERLSVAYAKARAAISKAEGA